MIWIQTVVKFDKIVLAWHFLTQIYNDKGIKRSGSALDKKIKDKTELIVVQSKRNEYLCHCHIDQNKVQINSNVIEYTYLLLLLIDDIKHDWQMLCYSKRKCEYAWMKKIKSV